MALEYIKQKLAFLDAHTMEVIKKSSSSSVVNILGKIVAFGLSIFLGRTLGADGLGIINLSNRLLGFFVTLCLFGVPNSLIKETSIAFRQHNWSRIGNSMYTAFILNGGMALAVAVSGILLADYLAVNIFNESRLEIPLIIIFAVLPFQVFLRNYAAGLIGDLKIWQSNLAEHALSIFITGLLLIGLWIVKIPITIINAALCYGVGRFLTFSWISWYWRQIYTQKTIQEFIGREILRTAMPFFMVGLTGLVLNSVDTIMLGWLDSSKQVGLYTTALQIAMVTSFFYQVTNSSVSPKISSLFAEGKMKELETMIQRVTFGLLILGAGTLILFIFTGKYLLMIWGQEFVEAYWILVVLGAGQFVNIGTGSVSSVLNMCGLEKMHGLIAGSYAILNIILNYLLIIHLGALGAAIATAITTVLQNLTKVIIAKWKLDIWTLPLKYS